MTANAADHCRPTSDVSAQAAESARQIAGLIKAAKAADLRFLAYLLSLAMAEANSLSKAGNPKPGSRIGE